MSNRISPVGGAPEARQIHYPFGEVRWAEGSPHTDYGYAGQRYDSYTQLIHMGARWYEPSLGRWISADTIVPDSTSPQSLNRYSYVLGNPLRYTDPTGYYSEDEIMNAFGVSTWDEVLNVFGEGGDLEGRWGWLEILRRASNGNVVTGWGGDYIGVAGGDADDLPMGSGEIYLQDGEITIGGMTQVRFASPWSGYSLGVKLSLDGTPGLLLTFSTDATEMHAHLRLARDSRPLSQRPEDRRAASQDATSIALDVGASIGFFAGLGVPGVVVQAVQLGIDVPAFLSGVDSLLRFRQDGVATSDDIAGIVGVVPKVGSFVDAIHGVATLGGYRIVYSP